MKSSSLPIIFSFKPTIYYARSSSTVKRTRWTNACILYCLIINIPRGFSRRRRRRRRPLATRRTINRTIGHHRTFDQVHRTKRISPRRSTSVPSTFLNWHILVPSLFVQNTSIEYVSMDVSRGKNTRRESDDRFAYELDISRSHWLLHVEFQSGRVFFLELCFYVVEERESPSNFVSIALRPER